MSNSSSSSSGIGFFGLLTICFIVMKLLELQPIASWSWFWVLSPIIIPFLILLVIIVFLIIASSKK